MLVNYYNYFIQYATTSDSSSNNIYMYKLTNKVLAVFAFPLNEVRIGMQISVSRGLKTCRARVGISVVIKAGLPRTFINRNSYSSEDKWKCRRSLFGVVCFKTSKWVYQQLHQVAEYVKRLGIVL